MIRYPNLIPECNVDTAFVEMLGYQYPNHAPNIHKVCLILEKQNPNTPCIGFIDDDKKKPSYISNFKPENKSKYFSIFRHTTKNQFLVVAMPAMDRVIYDLCNDLEINISKYRFPSDFKAFLACTKKLSIKRDPNFKNLLNAIKQKDPKDIQIVKSLIAKYYIPPS